MARVPGPGIRHRPRLHQLRAGRQQRVDQGVSRPVRRQGQEKGEAMTDFFTALYLTYTINHNVSVFLCKIGEASID